MICCRRPIVYSLHRARRPPRPSFPAVALPPFPTRTASSRLPRATRLLRSAVGCLRNPPPARSFCGAAGTGNSPAKVSTLRAAFRSRILPISPSATGEEASRCCSYRSPRLLQSLQGKVIPIHSLDEWSMQIDEANSTDT
jgi:hypothetical protein